MAARRPELAVSHISWSSDKDKDALETLADLKVSKIDVAPGIAFPQVKVEGPGTVGRPQIAEFKNRLAGFGLEVAGMQSLTFGRSENIFTSSKSELLALREYLTGIFTIAERLGARTLIYGSPSTRKSGDLDASEIEGRAQEFFSALDPIAYNSGVLLGIEPVSKTYTEGQPVFGNTGEEVVNFLQSMYGGDRGGSVRFVPDTFAMHDGKDDPQALLARAAALGILAPHMQIAEPEMGVHKPFSPIDHPSFDRAFSEQVDTLMSEGESPIISIEMTRKESKPMDPYYLRRAVRTAQGFYHRSL